MRKQDMSSGSGAMFSGKTPGSVGVKGVPQGVGGRPMTGPSKKARSDVGFPGVADSSLGPDDHVQSAK